jgi:hypothetical protein
VCEISDLSASYLNFYRKHVKTDPAYRGLTDIPRAGPAFPDFADAPLKNAVVQIGCGKFVAKLFVKVLGNATISGLHGSEILG